MKTRVPLLVSAAVILATAGACAVIAAFDPETRDLDDKARAAAPGAFVKLSDGVTHYEIGGPERGPVVVLVAGFSVPYYIWDPTFAALTAAGFRVVRYDFYGRGYSDRLDVEYTLDLYVRQIDELMAALHIDGPIDLVGLSFGGAVVTSFADAHEDRVRSLVYFDPAFRSPHPAPQYASTPWLWEWHAILFDEDGWATGQLEDFYAPEKFPDWPKRYREQMQLRGFRHARFRVVTSSLDFDQREQLARVGTQARQVLVVCGKQDRSVSFSSCERLLTVMPRARLVGVDHAGHLPMWEQPELVHHELISFLRPPPVVVPADDVEPIEEGPASFYADMLAGSRTASGEPYRPDKATCAHPTQSLGTVLEVTNVQNGKKARCRVNDRGPNDGEHIIDLSKKVARALDMLDASVVPVRVQVADDQDDP